MLSKSSAFVLVLCVLFPLAAKSDPQIGDMILPPASFTYISEEKTDLLISIGLDPGPAFCYDNDANAILITAPARAKAECELNTLYKLEKQKAKYQFDIGRLEAKIETLESKHKEINIIKDREIEKLTIAAMKRPNDYSIWWATGGFATGVLTTVAIFFMVN